MLQRPSMESLKFPEVGAVMAAACAEWTATLADGEQPLMGCKFRSCDAVLRDEHRTSCDGEGHAEMLGAGRCGGKSARQCGNGSLRSRVSWMDLVLLPTP